MMAFTRANLFCIALWMQFLGRVCLLAMLILGCAILPACTCSNEKARPLVQSILVCKPHTPVHRAPPFVVKEIVPGVLPVSFSAMDSGDAALSIPIAVSPGRDAPDLRVSYSSSSGENMLGAGFSLNAASSITRCPKTIALDATIQEVTFDDDVYCLDGKRLVEVARNGESMEFRTFPDTQIRILGHVLETGPDYFEAWFPSGERIDYGKTPETRPMAVTGVPRAWLAGEKRTARGKTIQYDWCFAEDESGYTAEYALTSIRYSAFDGVEPERAVVFDSEHS